MWMVLSVINMIRTTLGKPERPGICSACGLLRFWKICMHILSFDNSILVGDRSLSIEAEAELAFAIRIP